MKQKPKAQAENSKPIVNFKMLSFENINVGECVCVDCVSDTTIYVCYDSKLLSFFWCVNVLCQMDRIDLYDEPFEILFRIQNLKCSA